MEQKQIDSWSSWLSSYNFEALITVRLPPNLPIHSAHELYISDVIRPLGKYLKTRIGCYTAIVPATGQQAHLHSLVVSHGYKLSGRTDELQTHLRSLTTTLNSHERAIDIRSITGSKEVANYVAGHMTPETEFRDYCSWLVAKRSKVSDVDSLF